MKKLIATACLAILVPTDGAPNALSAAAPSAPPHVYTQTGAWTVRKIGGDLCGTLDESYQKKVDPDAILMEPLDAPVITPVPGTGDGKKLHQVFVSAGYVDLINHIAHAKAIDKIQPGYFAQYARTLARSTGNAAPPEPPDLGDDRYWSDDVMSAQVSYFNQMLGMTMALSLSQHYLGHVNKYANQMLGGKLVPINSLLARKEWEESVRKATLNSLNCALGTDGVKALFDAIDNMPQRPAWTAFIVPQNVDLKQLNQTLADYEVLYFHGGLK